MNKDKEDKQLLPAEIRRQIIRDVIEVEKEVSEEFLKFQSNDRDAYLSQAMQKIAGKYATRWQEAEKRAEKLAEIMGRIENEAKLYYQQKGSPIAQMLHQLSKLALSEYRDDKNQKSG